MVRAGHALVVSLLLAGAGVEPLAAAPDPAAARRVVVLYSYAKDSPANVRFERGVQSALAAAASPIEYYPEYLESNRFVGADSAATLRDYLRRKYGRQAPDVVITLSSTALDFMAQHRDLFGDVPLVFHTDATQDSRLRRSVSNATGVVTDRVFAKTLRVALDLHRQTREVLVVTGTADRDRLLEPAVRDELREFERQVRLVYLADLPLTALLTRIKAATDGSLVLYARNARAGQNLDPSDMLSLIAGAANVPVYALSGSLLGRGSVGGYVADLEEAGARAGEMAVNILSGAKPSDIPRVTLESRLMFDWRQLRRWRIAESGLPAGSVVLFRELSVWQRYRGYLIVGLLILAAQSGLVGGLLMQRGRRRRAEAQSRYTEEQYRSVVETQSELICRFMPDTTLTFVNDAYCRFWNRTREELLGQKFIQMVPPAGRQEVLDRLGRLVRGTDAHEYQVLLPDGTVGWHQWVNQAILDERGRFVELQGVGRDITDRKRAEEALVRLEARNSAMLRAIPDLMFVMRRDGTYVDYHARDPKLLFAPPDVFMGKTVHDIMPRELADTVMEAIERACRSDEPIVVEYELPFDEPKQFEARIVNAGQDRVLSMVRDVTESKRAIELNRDLAGRLIESQENERRRIARELHDDLGQQIALLNIEIDQIASELRDETIRTRLQKVSTHAGEIARELHDLSYELHPSKLQTLGLVSAIESLVRDMSQQSGVEISFSHGDLPITVEPNVSLCLYRIAQEALHNVARHSRAREAQVRLTRNGDELFLQIADSGVGFHPQEVSDAGLGLVSMRERVALLKGQLAIRTFKDGGTRIGVRVPLTPPAVGVPAIPKSA
jgi:PAS domain S-box-containing protein